jgi:hypothetical protein
MDFWTGSGARAFLAMTFGSICIDSLCITMYVCTTLKWSGVGREEGRGSEPAVGFDL